VASIYEGLTGAMTGGKYSLRIADKVGGCRSQHGEVIGRIDVLVDS
jgi:hypothetical protein